MPQVFSRRADRRFGWAVGMAAVSAMLGIGLAFAHARSGGAWAVGRPAPQPIPFSHAVHAGGLGLDCRFCHAQVEHAAAAGMPTAETCLGCHARVWSVTAQLAPLTTALAQGTPVVWSSAHRLPDHVRFHHGAHLHAGIGCQTCHGAVDAMPQTARAQTLSMGWCLDCHRQAATHEAAGRAETPPLPDGARIGLAAQTIMHEGISIPALTRCSTCHR